jgi:hypothetical protein
MARARRKTEDQIPTATVAVRVPAALAEAFEEVANREDRTVSAELRRLMRIRVAEVLPQGEVAAA